MKNILSFTVILLIISLISCNTNRYVYSASAPNNPYFTKKGDSKLTAYYSSTGRNSGTASDLSSTMSTKGYSNGWDLQGGYATGNHLSIIAGYYNKREKDIYDQSANFSPFNSSIVKYKRNLFETGAGYFVALNHKKTITFNVYGGAGMGKFSFEDNGIDKNNLSYSRYHRASISKWYLQPSFNFMPGNYIRLSLVLKYSFVHYGNIQTSYTSEELKDFSLDGIANKTLGFYEPSENIQFGLPKYPWIKFDFTLSSVIGLDPMYTVAIRHVNSSIGLNIDFSKLKKRSVY